MHLDTKFENQTYIIGKGNKFGFVFIRRSFVKEKQNHVTDEEHKQMKNVWR